MIEVERRFTNSEQWGTSVIAIPAGTSIAARMRVESVLEGILVTGSAQARATGECVRCLADIEDDLLVLFSGLFAYPQRAQAAADAGDEDEDEVYAIDHDLIDLEPLIRDSLVTALPFQPLCQADCMGLCPECGFRLADDPDHQHESIDSRWAVLQDVLREAKNADETKES
ncbi:YceD family protein [Rarobacter incanus]|uniref:YceD family protein n=1 Tax=Rarobacter incanus TaxID=153494 RepID=UPI001151DCE9|nr:DUF177 domain-containing protein [Rarobacter incanus]